MKRILSFILIIILISTGCGNLTKDAGKIIQRGGENNKVIKDKITTYTDDFAKQQNFSGVILVAKENDILFEKGYGMANYEENQPNNPKTSFRIASITKQITAMCIIILRDMGKISLSDKVNKYIPGFPNGDKITIENLITHSSGITEDLYGSSTIEVMMRHNTPIQLVNMIEKKNTNPIPNVKFQYCNSNYILLGYIIERVSGMKYENFINRYIFKPLDMKDSRYDTNKIVSENEAVGYLNYNQGFIDVPNYDMSAPYAAGAVRSTVHDLLKWDRALYTEKLVKKSSIEDIFKPRVEEGNNLYYGYGWNIETENIGDNKYNLFWHYGNIPGFNTFILHDNDEESVVIILSNRDSGLMQGNNPIAVGINKAAHDISVLIREQDKLNSK
ncbi:MAG: serine hydrolase domain-containing protein [Bacillota bacterium]|nr:serine hydrolase domain-containing protein [Bacillota bacterium]